MKSKNKNRFDIKIEFYKHNFAILLFYDEHSAKGICIYYIKK